MKKEKPYWYAEKLIKKIKKQKHPEKKLVNKAIDEVTEGMKKTMPKYIYRNGFRINLHDMLA